MHAACGYNRRMKILAFETSGEAGSVAVRCGLETHSLVLETGPAQSATVLQRVSKLLADASCRVGDLTGSPSAPDPAHLPTETWLRPGPGAGDGGRNRSGAGRHARCAGGSGRRQDRRRGNRRTDGRALLGGFHCLGGMPVANWPPGCIAPADWTIPATDSPLIGIGSAFRVHAGALEEGLRARFSTILDDRSPAAEDVAALAARRLVEQPALDPALASPVYVRNKVASTTAERLAQGGRA